MHCASSDNHAAAQITKNTMQMWRTLQVLQLTTRNPLLASHFLAMGLDRHALSFAFESNSCASSCGWYKIIICCFCISVFNFVQIHTCSMTECPCIQNLLDFFVYFLCKCFLGWLSTSLAFEIMRVEAGATIFSCQTAMGKYVQCLPIGWFAATNLPRIRKSPSPWRISKTWQATQSSNLHTVSPFGQIIGNIVGLASTAF